MIKREERLENVQRIYKANKYAQEVIKKKIEEDDARGKKLQEEKSMALETRLTIRRQAEKQKKEMLEKVEKLKQQGNFNKDKLAELGLVDSSQDAGKGDSRMENHVDMDQ